MGALPRNPAGLIGGAVLCLILSAFFITKALIPGWRGKWGWGRGTGRPISTAGHIGISVAFLTISIGLSIAYFHVEPEIGFFLVLAGFVIFIVAGVIDGRRSEEK